MSTPVDQVTTQILRSYPYEQYADDDDIQAFVRAYNDAAQSYLTWLVSINLPDWTGLSGPLLDWVADGLYGMQRTALASPTSSALGMLNTEVVNTDVLDGYTPSSTVFYALSDDLFQRILTWNLYKGDGKRFTLQWLKRRIMRFLVGNNGTDPQPSNPAFTIGAETYNALSVTVSSGTVNVVIYGALLQAQAPLAPNVMELFALAFASGVLELPLQYAYTVTVTYTISTATFPNALTVNTTSTDIVTPGVMVEVFAGSGAYTYAWSWQSGGAGITINAPTAAYTTFVVNPATAGNSYAGVAQCVVTDTSTSNTSTCTVSISINCMAVDILIENGNLLLAENGLPILEG